MKIGRIRLTAVLLLLALVLAPGALAAETVREGEKLTVTGTVRSITDTEDPGNYTFDVLTLTQPLGDIAEVQVSGFDAAGRAKALSGKEVTVTGTVVFAHTRYHYRDVVLVECTVQEAAPASPAPAPQTPAAPGAVAAKAGNIALRLDGAAVQLGTYNIANNNYVKLRDVAQLLTGTAKSFSVAWNGGAQRIDLTSGQAYVSEGGELAPLAAGEQAALPSTASVWLDGKSVALTAYNIKNNNFFKLRDLGSAMGFYVGWDAAAGTVVVDTSRGYSEDPPASAGASDTTDQELLALAKDAGNGMKNMIYGVNQGALLEQDWGDTIQQNGLDCCKVPGYAGMKDLENYWYQKFARKYTMDQVTGGEYRQWYFEQNGALYTRNMGIGDDMQEVAVDKLVSRSGDEAVFSGHLVDVTDNTSGGAVEFSLVYEGGEWKYGRYNPTP